MSYEIGNTSRTMNNMAVALMLILQTGCDKAVQSNLSSEPKISKKVENIELEKTKVGTAPKEIEILENKSNFNDLELVDGIVVEVPNSMVEGWGYEYCDKNPKACPKLDSGEVVEKFTYGLDGQVLGFSFAVPIAHAFDTNPVYGGKTRNADKIKKYKKCEPNDDEKMISEELGSYSETSEFRCRGDYIFAIDRGGNGAITYSMIWRVLEDMS